MSINEMRKDYLLDRWVVISTARKKRPTDFVKQTEEGKAGTCPLCPENEHMTPPATLVYIPLNGKTRKEKDENGFRHKNWLIRCVPNLYPAFTPPNNEEKSEAKEDSTFAKAIGHHEVIIESPHHDEHPGVVKTSQLIHVINAYIDRLHEFSAKKYVKYVSIFRNHGQEAGASLSHAHTQIITTPIIPKIVEDELRASEKFWAKKKNCIFCDILQKERASTRLIWESDGFVVFAPWASVHPFEFWVFPKRHQCCLLDLSLSEVKALAKTMRVSLGGLKTLLNDPPYNFGFHQITCGAKEHFHWHLEVYPRLAIWAGFEKSTGMFINAVPPEDAAVSLRETFLAEEKKIQ
jgi:UDPglucose--hexose-1-phosphate uridylyltransferase